MSTEPGTISSKPERPGGAPPASADQPIVLATHAKRLAAALLDGVFGVVAAGVFGALGWGVGTVAGAGSDGWDALGWVLGGAFLGLVVGTLAWLALTARLVCRSGAHNGQTLGKQLVDVRAVRADLAPIRGGQALTRELGGKGLLVALLAVATSTFLGFADGGLAGALVAAAALYGPTLGDDQRRGLHDRLVDTRVVAA